MVVNAFYYIFTIIIVVVFFLLTQDPYVLKISKSSLDIENVMMEDIVDYEIVDNAIVRITKANEAIRFKDKDMLKNALMTISDKNQTYDIFGTNVYLYSENIVLDQNVSVIRDDGVIFKTDNIIYDKTKKQMSSSSDFIITSPTYITKGVGFLYDFNSKNINANKIQFDYDLDKK